MAFEVYTLAEIKAIAIGRLREFAKEIGVRGPTMLSKEALENAVYERLKEIEAQRSVPSELLAPKSRAAILNKTFIEETDRTSYGPFKDKPDGEYFEFSGRFRPYKDKDGIICMRLTPHDDDIFVSEDFVCAAQLRFGDRVVGKYAVNAETKVKIVAEIATVNGKRLDEHRAAGIEHRRRYLASEPLKLWSDRTNIRALALAAPLKRGSRVLLAHDGLTSLTDYTLRLADCLKSEGFEVLSLYLDAAPESEELLQEREGVYACAFDLGEEFIVHSLEMTIEAAYRCVEENKHLAVIVDNIEACKSPALARMLLGCACSIDGGSITVFATVNEDIMDKRDLGLLTNIADAKVKFVNDAGAPAVDFKRCCVKTDKCDYPLLRRLQSVDGATVQLLIANLDSREAAEKLLK